jgi:hypothetical protein
MEHNKEQRQRATSICSSVLDDGSIVEMLYRPDLGETTFAASKDNSIHEIAVMELSTGGRIVPYSARNNLLAHGVVLLPSQATEYESDEKLLAEVREFIHRYCDVSVPFEEISAHYVSFTWIYDVFNEVPYLRVRGDFGSGKSRYLLTVGSLCYKPIFASGASTVSPIFRILDAFRGTLILDESDFRVSDEKTEIVKILNNGNTRGFPVLRSEATPTKEYNPRAFHVFGPKIIASRSNFSDKALESRCITEDMGRQTPRPEIPLNLPAEFAEEATTLRNKLLMFRFKNRSKSRDLNTIADRSLEPRIAQIFSPLLATIESEAVRQSVLALARRYSGVIASERSTSIEAQLLQAIHDLWSNGMALSVKDITERFVSRYGEDYRRPPTPRWIGALLRSRLSLVPAKSHGTFVIPATEEPKLKHFFERYGFGDDGDFGDVDSAQALEATSREEHSPYPA